MIFRKEDCGVSDIPKIGFFAAMTAFAAVVLFGVSQVLQIMGVLRPPLDGVLLYSFSLCIVVPFIIAMLASHYVTPIERNFGATQPSFSQLCTAATSV
jgi:hypothetical protein